MVDDVVTAIDFYTQHRIHLIVRDIAAEVEQLRAAGLTFRNDIVAGPGSQQILLEDPSGNAVALFQPAGG